TTATPGCARRLAVPVSVPSACPRPRVCRVPAASSLRRTWTGFVFSFGVRRFFAALDFSFDFCSAAILYVLRRFGPFSLGSRYKKRIQSGEESPHSKTATNQVPRPSAANSSGTRFLTRLSRHVKGNEAYRWRWASYGN